MANYSVLKAAVQAVVKTNGNQEITGANMQSTLISIINSLGTGYQFMGVATPSTSPGTPDYNVAYIGGAGTYANFGTSVTVPVGSIGAFKYNGSWAKEQVKLFDGVDNNPSYESTNLTESGGVFDYTYKSHHLIDRINDFDNGNIVKDKQLYNNNEIVATGCFITPYIEVSPTSQYKWYQGTDRSGTQVPVAGLTVLFYNEDKTQYAEFYYNSDPRTFTPSSSSLSFTIKYVRISFVRNSDCYLLDLTNKEFVWYGYYMGKDVIDENIKELADSVNFDAINKADALTSLIGIEAEKEDEFTWNDGYFSYASSQGSAVTVTPSTTVHYTNPIAVNTNDVVHIKCDLSYATILASTDSTGSYYSMLLSISTAAGYAKEYTFIVPEGVEYISLCGRKSGDTAIKAYILHVTENSDINLFNNGYPQSYDFYETALLNIRKPASRGNTGTGANAVLSLLFFSDIHGIANPLNRLLGFKDKYQNYIDDILFCGDLMNDHFGQTNIFSGNTKANKILYTIGNHDICRGNSVNPNDYVPYSGITTKQGYDAYISANISNWGVVQPTGASTYGLNYYYKDYTNIRLVVLDCYNPADSTYLSTEQSWFASVLSDAITQSKAVVAVAHMKADDLVYKRETGFCSYDRISNESIDSGFRQAVQTFINNGGEFICWLAGHTHYDLFGVCANNTDQTQLVITCAYADAYDDARVTDTPTQDSFNIIGFDTVSKIIKVLRVGNNIDRFLRPKNVLTWDYANRTIISTE